MSKVAHIAFQTFSGLYLAAIVCVLGLTRSANDSGGPCNGTWLWRIPTLVGTHVFLQSLLAYWFVRVKVDLNDSNSETTKNFYFFNCIIAVFYVITCWSECLAFFPLLTQNPNMCAETYPTLWKFSYAILGYLFTYFFVHVGICLHNRCRICRTDDVTPFQSETTDVTQADSSSIQPEPSTHVSVEISSSSCSS